MDDLISRKAVLEFLGEPHPLDYIAIAKVQRIIDLPSVPAVPLDKLCEWLAEHSVIIPCETCRNFSNGYCMAIGDMDKPCPNKAEDWQRAIKEWMEGLDGSD